MHCGERPITQYALSTVQYALCICNMNYALCAFKIWVHIIVALPAICNVCIVLPCPAKLCICIVNITVAPTRAMHSVAHQRKGSDQIIRALSPNQIHLLNLCMRWE